MLILAYTLIALWVLPMVLLLSAILESSGFSGPSFYTDMSVGVVGVYLEPVRTALASFVVPFVAAYSISEVQEGKKINTQTLTMFFILVAVFLLAVIVAALLRVNEDRFLQSVTVTMSVDTKLEALYGEVLELITAYVKESLVYISLILGISQYKRSHVEGGVA